MYANNLNWESIRSKRTVGLAFEEKKESKNTYSELNFTEFIMRNTFEFGLFLIVLFFRKQKQQKKITLIFEVQKAYDGVYRGRYIISLYFLCFFDHISIFRLFVVGHTIECLLNENSEISNEMNNK